MFLFKDGHAARPVRHDSTHQSVPCSSTAAATAAASGSTVTRAGSAGASEACGLLVRRSASGERPSDSAPTAGAAHTSSRRITDFM